jgi:prepilin-type N-terminal cleavage/methylation domain-containing protein
MSHYNVHKSNSGFTLVELMISLVIIGVIAALTAPNFLGLLSRNRVNDAALQVEGALKEAQRQAMRQGRQCTININAANQIISNPVTPGTNGCLLKNRDLNNSSSSMLPNPNSAIQLNSTRAAIIFSGKGNYDNNTGEVVLVVSMPNRTPQRKCVVLNGLFGVLWSGDYSTALNPGESPVSNSCQ